MRSKPLVFGDQLEEKYRDTLLIQSFLQDGNIDFGKSDTKTKPCKKYIVEKEQNKENIRLLFMNCADTVVVESKVVH